MAKSKVKWNGTTEDGRTTSVVWGSNPFTWDDVALAIEVADVIDIDGKGTYSRREREDRLNSLDKNKKKRLIRLICRVKGEKVYDEQKEVGEVDIKLKDAELVVNEVLSKIKVEKTNVL
tara:strand:+ start:202 stop:558 length:357 start_codon:yes stop_codon:yes gene_type:complete